MRNPMVVTYMKSIHISHVRVLDSVKDPISIVSGRANPLRMHLYCVCHYVRRFTDWHTTGCLSRWTYE